VHCQNWCDQGSRDYLLLADVRCAGSNSVQVDQGEEGDQVTVLLTEKSLRCEFIEWQSRGYSDFRRGTELAFLLLEA
jgi:hypothetical protein